MKNIISIRKFTVGVAALFLFSASALAGLVVHKQTGTSTSLLQPYLQLAADLGGGGHPDGGSYTSGYRVVNWDEVPDNIAVNSLPPDFFNTTVQRGMVLSSAWLWTILRLALFSGNAFHFGNFNANYTTDFQHFIGSRLFSAHAGACNYVDVTFYIPGTKVPATVNGFGILFADVDTNTSTGLICYGVDGQPLGPRQGVLEMNNGLSLLGVSYNGGERIARVRIFSGTSTLGQLDKSRGGTADVVVMDSIIYGEPRAIGQHPSDFDGDGTSDLSVFRPSTGAWYILQSGSNTISSAQFGMAGDTPVDGDFDGDSRNDLAVFRPSSGIWYVLRSSNGEYQPTQFGSGGDKPIGGDFDKDGISDIAVWRPSDGNYYLLKSSTGEFTVAHWGANGDIPIGAGNP